jgi:hypothetical protein
VEFGKYMKKMTKSLLANASKALQAGEGLMTNLKRSFVAQRDVRMTGINDEI